MSSLLTRVIYIFVAFAIVTAIGFSIPALVQNSTTAAAAEVRCPCPLKEYFKLQTKYAKAFGIFDHDLLCNDTGVGPRVTLLAMDSDFGCSYRILAADTGGAFESNACLAIVLNDMDCPFNFSYRIDALTDAELAACRDAIIGVARSFQVTC